MSITRVLGAFIMVTIIVALIFRVKPLRSFVTGAA